MKANLPKKIFVENDITEHPLTRQILGKLPDIPVQCVDDYRNIKVEGTTPDDVFRESKESLAIAKKKGELVKQFRCRDGIRGDSEFYIIHGNNCSYDCEYCFLQSYFSNAVPTLFVNHEELLLEIRDVIRSSVNNKIVFHAGELCDSLAFDDLTGLSCKLVSLFSEFPHATLELRTKTVTIQNLLRLSGHGLNAPTAEASGNIVISWTFTPQPAVEKYEHKTPSLYERIEAANRVQEAGYLVGICFDPIIRYNGWLENYETMITELFNRLDTDKIRFVSLGGFRFLPSLAGVIKERNTKTDLLLDEFVPCIDGKYRYFRPIRVEMYRKLWNMIGEKFDNSKVSLCMESHEVWNEVGKDVRR